MISDSDIQKTVTFFETAFPNPVSKNFHTQLGVHLEELVETLGSLVGQDEYTEELRQKSVLELKLFSDWLKWSDNVISIHDPVGFLDGLCDQLVTATGVAHMAGMDIAGGFGEVNRSNNSKFDDNGLPILDSNLKMTKGPRYFKPNLKQFIGHSSSPSVRSVGHKGESSTCSETGKGVT